MPPKKRRGRRGDGSFYQRKSDGLWIGSMVYEDEYGDKKRASVSHADKAEAMQKFRELRAKVEAGNYRPNPKMKLGPWLDYWVENMVRPNLKPKTARSYSDTCKNQIKPLLGDERLPIQPAKIRGMLRRIGDADGWGERTVQNSYVVLNIALNAAKREGVIEKNPCDVIAKPKVTESGKEKAMTSEQARKVLLSAMEAKDPMVTRWAAAFLLGARQAEMLGLERNRVDVEEMTIDLSWQLQTLEIEEGKKLTDEDRFIIPNGFEVRPLYRTFAFTRPKSDKSKRVTPLPTPLAAIFRAYLDVTPENRFGLMWVTPKGTPIPGKYDSDWWHAALARARVPDFPLHAARHTTATLLQEMGVEESVRMQIMGHNTVAAARRYAHVPLEAARKALGNLDGLLELE